MQSTSHISPITFVVPFFVMFAVVGVAMFAAGTGTDLRSHASNDSEKSCVAKCTSMGGASAACTNVCPKILKGTMSCKFASESVGVKSPIFMNACETITPKEKSCDQICTSVGTEFGGSGGVVRSVCKKVCPSVKSGKKTCDQVCKEGVPKGAQGKSFIGSCLNACKNIPVEAPKKNIPDSSGEAGRNTGGNSQD